MGIVLGEIAAFAAVMGALILVFRWLSFKLKCAVRDDKTSYFERHGLDINKDENQ